MTGLQRSMGRFVAATSTAWMTREMKDLNYFCAVKCFIGAEPLQQWGQLKYRWLMLAIHSSSTKEIKSVCYSFFIASPLQVFSTT